MSMEQCPQCKESVKEPSNRLVQDACGHKKCRKCLLKDEFLCQLCHTTNNQSVIKYENSTNAIKVGSATNKSDNDNVPQEDNINHEITSTKADPKIDADTNEKEVIVENENYHESLKRPYNRVETPTHIIMLSERHYRCTICSKEFTTKSNIKYHMFCIGGKKPFSCSICKKEFITKSHYESHRLSHLETKPYACDICKKTFSQKSKLNRHTLLHSSSSSFMCQDCGKTFRSKDYLKTHTVVHQNEKPFACKHCNAKFNNSSNLKKHLASHSTEKAHMCDQCGKRFKLKWALTVHRRSHSSQRPFKCTHCSKAFVNSKDLQRHKLIHSDVKGFSCGICLTNFRRKDNLERHIKNSHPGKKVPHIKNKVEVPKKPEPPVPATSSVVDNPNAINVITSSTSQVPKKEEHPSKQINVPLKLAFKTSAFKNCYNIHRDYVEPQVEAVNVYQKILSPHTSDEAIINVASQEQEKPTTEPITPFRTPGLHYETSFEHKTHAIIKNIKFKLPSKYTNLKSDKSNPEKDNIPLKLNGLGTNATSVIVNTPINENYLRKKNLK